MKKVIFIRSSDIYREPRAPKEIDMLKNSYDVEVLCWDRERKFQKKEISNNYYIHRCHIKGKYGGGLKQIFSVVIWWIYEFFWLFFHKFDALHVCDFDVYFPALLAAKLKGKKIVYDIFDFYGDMIRAPNWIKNIIKKIDLFLMRFADGVIVTDDNRINQVKDSKPGRLTVIYNTPPDFYSEFYSNIERKRNSSDFTFGYIGLIGEGRGCDILLKMVAEIQGVNFIFGGISIQESEDELKKKFGGMTNVSFFGKVFPYKKTLEMLSKCDVMFALYDPAVQTHKYSSANKIFESMMLSKPIIVTRNTGMDKIVENHQTGLIVEYGDKEQLKLAIIKLMEMKKQKIFFHGDNGRKSYEKFFSFEIMKERLLNLYYSILH